MSVNVFGPAGQQAFEGAQTIRVFVEENGDAISTPGISSYDPLGGEISIDGVGYGTNRQLVIEGWTVGPSGELAGLLCRGKSLRTTVVEGDAGHALNVMVAPVNALVPLTDANSRAATVLTQGRIGHSVTKTDTGEIIVAGGGTVASPQVAWWQPEPYETFLPSIEVIKEANGTAQLLPSAMVFGRIWHTGTALPTGKVLLAGGSISTKEATDRVEVYSPGDAPSVALLQHLLSTPRWGHTATLVDPESYTLLIVGGDEDETGVGTYELWNPYVGTLKSGPLPDNTMRRHHQATLFEIPSRGPAVLITGGETSSSVLDSVLIYDVVTDTMMVSPLKLTAPVTQHAAVWVPGRNYVYVVGGYTGIDRKSASANIDVYDTINNVLFAQPGFSLVTARGGHTAVAGPNNLAIFVGGTTASNVALNSIEVIYEYLDPEINKFRIEVAQSSAGRIPFLSEPSFGQGSVFVDGGMMLLVGGMTQAGALTSDLTLFNPL